MGTEAAWVPLVIAAVAAAGQQYNTHQTAKKRDAEIAEGIRKSGIQQDRANKVIDTNLDELSESRVDPYKQQLRDLFLDKVRKTQALGTAGLNAEGKTSDAYKKSAANAKTGAVDYAGVISSLLAGVDAAGNQRTAEGKSASDVGSDILKFKRNSDQDAFLAQLRAKRHRNNPYIDIGSAALSGYATGGAGYGGRAV